MKSHQQIVGIDVLRFLAAFWVMLFHLGFWDWTGADPRAHLPDAFVSSIPFFSSGWVGVEIFFALSGYVIAYSTEGNTSSRFLLQRFKRLCPTVLICASITALILLTAYSWRSVSVLWLTSVSLLPVGPWVDGVYWTLPIEVSFYALILLLLSFGNGRHLFAGIAVLGLISSMGCLCSELPYVSAARLIATHWGILSFPPLACLLLVHGCFFSFGSFLYRCMMNGLTITRACMLVLCGSGCLCELDRHHVDFAHASHTSSSGFVTTGAWIGAMILIACSVKWNGSLRDWIGPRGITVIRELGLSTFPLYLLHNSFGRVAMSGFHRYANYRVALGSAVLLTMGISLFVSKYLEPPLRHLLPREEEALR